MADLVLNWRDNPYKNSASLAKGMSMSQFEIEDYTANKTIATYVSGKFQYITNLLVHRTTFSRTTLLLAPSVKNIGLRPSYLKKVFGDLPASQQYDLYSNTL